MKTIKLKNNLKVLVDNKDFNILNQYTWGVLGKKYLYAARGTRKKGQKYKKILMHREIMGNPKNMMIDHVNGNTLDNRRKNLRIVTRAQNLMNSKLRNDSLCNYKGVSKRKNKFIARIQINKNNRLYLGEFNTEKEAANAYNKAAVKYFGKFAKLNK